MSIQNFEKNNKLIREKFEYLKKTQSENLKRKLNLSWSNWGFGMEDLALSAKRLAACGISYIELHGNHYGPDLGYKPKETLKILNDYEIKVAGICGMFSAENDLSSNSGVARQNAIDYIKRELDFASAVGAKYMLIVPGAVGRPCAYDQSEFKRSAETLRIVADEFVSHNIKAAIEPIRSAEVSIIHTIEDVKKYINVINHPGINHINGDVYHMQSEEQHIGMSILAAGRQLVNLHMADSNRCAFGDGSMDLDTIIMALYIIGFNQPDCFVTPEPLGPGGDPYPAMHGRTDPEILNKLVHDTTNYFNCRQQTLLS